MTPPLLPLSQPLLVIVTRLEDPHRNGAIVSFPWLARSTFVDALENRLHSLDQPFSNGARESNASLLV